MSRILHRSVSSIQISEKIGFRNDVPTEEGDEDEDEDEEEEEVAEDDEDVEDELDEGNVNHEHQPFRDTKSKAKGKDVESIKEKFSEISIDKNYVRSKVKQSLQKKLKREHHRLCSKGESALITAQRRDQRETIQLHLE